MTTREHRKTASGQLDAFFYLSGARGKRRHAASSIAPCTHLAPHTTALSAEFAAFAALLRTRAFALVFALPTRKTKKGTPLFSKGRSLLIPALCAVQPDFSWKALCNLSRALLSARLCHARPRRATSSCNAFPGTARLFAPVEAIPCRRATSHTPATPAALFQRRFLRPSDNRQFEEPALKRLSPKSLLNHNPLKARRLHARDGSSHNRPPHSATTTGMLTRHSTVEMQT